MKRTVAAILSLVIILSLVACQPSPREGVVAEKDSELMLEKAQKDSSTTNDGSSLSEQYHIPEHYQFEAAGADGNLNIIVDAQVIVPDVSALPIYRVKAAEFSQETVSVFFQALCGDAEMYVESGQRTKEQIQQDILELKGQIATLEADPQHSDEQLEMAKSGLAQLEQELKTASDTLEEERTDGTLLKEDNTISNASPAESDEPTVTPRLQTGGSGTHLDAYERYNGGIGRVFGVNNDSTPAMLYADNRNEASGNSFGQSSSLPILEDSDIDEESLFKVGIKPSEARRMVQSLLDKTGMGMKVDRIYLQDDTTYYDEGTVEPAEHYAYLVYCVRTVNGLPCAYTAGASYQADDAVAPYWQYEEMYFLVNSEGIFQMWWTCPIEIVETVNVDAQLKPFPEIQEIFEKMMLVKYEAQAENSKEDFIISRVTLSLHRIIEKNSNESGLLVPAWNFYGKRTSTWSDSSGYGEPIETLDQSFLTINAIDGSIIDISKGY